MSSQAFLYIPDAIAMLLLMAVLVYLRGQSHARDATLWLVGLSFIVLEALTSDAYRADFGPHVVMHMVAMTTFALGGFTFAWAALRDGRYRRIGLGLCLSGAAPMLVIAILYGAGSVHVRAFELLGGLALVSHLVCMVVLGRDTSWMALGMLVISIWWGPVIGFARMGQFRSLMYWALGVLYLLVAVAMLNMIRRSLVGGLVVITGFVTWSGCLLCHPYVLSTTVLGKLVDQTWTMQKFVVTIGLLLVLLDEELRHSKELALNDALTGLPNRRLLDDRLQQAMERSKRYGVNFALFVIDLNGFKAINDRLGHAQGDLVLREAARRLLGVVRSSDTLARTGGDEFVVVVNEVADDTRCELLAGMFQAALHRTDGQEEMGSEALAGSVGYAIFPSEAADADRLMAIADRRMYEQKAAGKISGERRIALVAPAFSVQEAGL